MAAPTVANTPSASYKVENVVTGAIATFGGSTHTSSGGDDRCLVAVIAARSNIGTSRTLTTLTWNGVTMSKDAEQRHSDSAGIGTTITICTLNDPAAATAGAISATYSGTIEHAQIWFYDVEGCPNGIADTFAVDVDDASGDTAVSISISPTVEDTLCIMGVTQLSSSVIYTFSPLTINDQKITATETLDSAIASGVLASSGAQNVTATLSGANEFSAAAITLAGAEDEPTARWQRMGLSIGIGL